ncbi:hypothetical protein ACRQ1B_24360 [Rhizobium panacihumi]|uniref:hypothetical protein n=1 Tax=Rhizobium panacihumi TaxID=2008450 RepID=UPI003D7B02C5
MGAQRGNSETSDIAHAGMNAFPQPASIRCNTQEHRLRTIILAAGLVGGLPLDGTVGNVKPHLQQPLIAAKTFGIGGNTARHFNGTL